MRVDDLGEFADANQQDYFDEELSINTFNIPYLYKLDDQVIISEEIENEVEKEYIFPESREERFLNKDLREFYKKKGYKTQK